MLYLILNQRRESAIPLRVASRAAARRFGSGWYPSASAQPQVFLSGVRVMPRDRRAPCAALDIRAAAIGTEVVIGTYSTNLNENLNDPPRQRPSEAMVPPFLYYCKVVHIYRGEQRRAMHLTHVTSQRGRLIPHTRGEGSPRQSNKHMSQTKRKSGALPPQTPQRQAQPRSTCRGRQRPRSLPAPTHP